MRKRIALLAVAVTWTGAFLEWWRRHPRSGATTVNRIVNPWLIRRGLATSSRGEIALLEHVGRSTGMVRVTPIHPVRTVDGFRIIVPLGGESQWALNVLAAGRCRVQIGDAVHELDEPRLLEPAEIAGMPKPAAAVMAWLGFRYLALHRFQESPGSLETAPREAAPAPTEVTSKPRRRVRAHPEAIGVA
jgi:deazaflavin-dependent oxidoreductase (nitroreductase family)